MGISPKVRVRVPVRVCARPNVCSLTAGSLGAVL
jgi:hypothetical protein